MKILGFPLQLLLFLRDLPTFIPESWVVSETARIVDKLLSLNDLALLYSPDTGWCEANLHVPLSMCVCVSIDAFALSPFETGVFLKQLGARSEVEGQL